MACFGNKLEEDGLDAAVRLLEWLESRGRVEVVGDESATVVSEIQESSQESKATIEFTGDASSTSEIQEPSNVSSQEAGEPVMEVQSNGSIELFNPSFHC